MSRKKIFYEDEKKNSLRTGFEPVRVTPTDRM